ncbi:hypothetical protein ACN27J_19450 [Solwaraspora sp. WMMB762]|uniref:hypothetical protein n=1 Tax=Solwaraspora sp. WMMB762 TaxID=3404120 RepID=UPI003B93DF60
MAVIQELRQMIASGRAIDPVTNTVVKAAQVCASPIQDNGDLIFQSKAPGQEIDGWVAAFLVVTDNKLIWLEFDNSGWAEQDYRRIVELAVDEAAKI